MRKWGYIIGAAFLITFGTPVMGQEDEEGSEQEDFRTEAEKKADREAEKYWDSLEEDDEDEKKGFYAGIYVGAMKADSYSARLYDGYGYERGTGDPNDWANAWLPSRIALEGSNTTPGGDAIAEALNVDPGQYIFTEEDMPTNMTYNIAFSFGLQGRYNFNNKNALLFNINFSRLTVNGQFTIELTTTPVGSNPSNPGEINYNDQIKTFGIRGDEQRVMLQAGYQRIFGNHEYFNFVGELGVDVTFAKFIGNQAKINYLTLDLTQQLNTTNGTPIPGAGPGNLTGAAVGVFGGLGVQLETGSKWTVQLLYNPIYQKIALGTDTKYGLHHTLGLRAIYNI